MAQTVSGCWFRTMREPFCGMDKPYGEIWVTRIAYLPLEYAFTSSSYRLFRSLCSLWINAVPVSLQRVCRAVAARGFSLRPFPSADLLSLKRQGVFGGTFMQYRWALSRSRSETRWLRQSAFVSRSRRLDSTCGTQSTRDAPRNVHYRNGDGRLHSMAAHPIRSQIMLESSVKD